MKIVDCQNCGKQTAKLNYRYNEAIRNGWNFFCSRKCRYAYQEKGIEFSCAWCSEFIKKTPAQIRQTKIMFFAQNPAPLITTIVTNIPAHDAQN